MARPDSCCRKACLVLLVATCAAGLVGCKSEKMTQREAAIAGDERGTKITCGDRAVMARFPVCKLAPNQASCEAAGGAWTPFVKGAGHFCQCPTGQAGCRCTTQAECLVRCSAPVDPPCEGLPSGTCDEQNGINGCRCLFEAGTTTRRICVN